MINAEDPN